MEKDIENLFTAIQEDHQRLDEKMDKGFREVAERFEQVDFSFKAVDDRFDVMDKRFDKVDEKLESIDDTLQVISVMAKTNEIEHRGFDRRLKKLEQAHA